MTVSEDITDRFIDDCKQHGIISLYSYNWRYINFMRAVDALKGIKCCVHIEGIIEEIIKFRPIVPFMKHIQDMNVSHIYFGNIGVVLVKSINGKEDFDWAVNFVVSHSCDYSHIVIVQLMSLGASQKIMDCKRYGNIKDFHNDLFDALILSVKCKRFKVVDSLIVMINRLKLDEDVKHLAEALAYIGKEVRFVTLYYYLMFIAKPELAIDLMFMMVYHEHMDDALMIADFIIVNIDRCQKRSIRRLCCCDSLIAKFAMMLARLRPEVLKMISFTTVWSVNDSMIQASLLTEKNIEYPFKRVMDVIKNTKTCEIIYRTNVVEYSRIVSGMVDVHDIAAAYASHDGITKLGFSDVMIITMID